MNVSLIVHTRNSAKLLARLLETTKWISDRVVVDMQSSDGTRDIAAQAGARVLTCNVAERIDAIRNHYINEAKHDWVLVLDSDESLSLDSQSVISSLIEGYGTRFNAFAIPRFNSVEGYVLRGSGWYPDHQIRLFRRGTVIWHDAHHVRPEVLGGDAALWYLCPRQGLHIHHENYRSISDLLERQLRYACTQRYDLTKFSFAPYLARAYQQLSQRHTAQHDGDLSKVLSLVMAWDSLIQGVVHWEKMPVRPPLPALLGAPIFVANDELVTRESKVQAKRLMKLEAKAAGQRKQIAKLEATLAAVQEGIPWRLSHWLERYAPLLKNLGRGLLRGFSSSGRIGRSKS